MKKALAELLSSLSLASATGHAKISGMSTGFLKSKYGLFGHCVWAGGGLTLDRGGKAPESFDALAGVENWNSVHTASWLERK